MLQNEIIDLLKINERVIIPDLGAIMVNVPKGELTFNEFLRFNDGLLIQYLASSRKISSGDASSEVKKFTNTIIKALAKEKEFDLSPLGKIYIDENEKIQLKQLIPANNFQSPVNITENKEHIIETPKTNDAYNAPKPKILPENYTNTLKETKVMIENASSSSSQNGSSSILDDYNFEERRPIWKTALIGLAVIAFLGAVVYVTFIKKPGLFSKKAEVAQVAELTPAEPEKKAEPIVNESAPVAVSPAKGNKYHIIAGAFIVEKNASAFMQDLQKKGYDPQVVLKRNEYSFISIFSYPTFKEANDKFKSFKDSGMPVWIMKY